MTLGRTAIVIGAAYLVIGFVYVRHKLSETNYLRIPLGLMSYRNKGGPTRLVSAILSWPFATFINSEFSYWLAFVILAAGAYLLSI